MAHSPVSDVLESDFKHFDDIFRASDWYCYPKREIPTNQNQKEQEGREYTGEIIIIGAGPVGCLLATFLVDLGFSCTVYEKRKDPRSTKDSGKSINFTLSCRGLTALDLLRHSDKKHLTSIHTALKLSGRAIHMLHKSNAFQPYSIHPDECLVSVNRRNLGNDLITIAMERGVKFLFEYSIGRINFESKEATFINGEDGTTSIIKYNVLFGADGSNSQVRREIERVLGLGNSTVKYTSGYQEYEIPPGRDGNFQLSPAEATHVWPRDSETFFIAFPNPDRSYTCTLFSPTEGDQCVNNMSDSQIVDLFTRDFADVYDLIGKEKIVHDHKNNPFGSLWIVDAQKWHYQGDVLLLGDAAHGVVPYLGLGINAGFEGVRHLINLIKKYSSQSSTATSSFYSPSSPSSHYDSDSSSDSYSNSYSLPSSLASSAASSTSQSSCYVVDWVSVFKQFNEYKKHTDVLKNASVRNSAELHRKIKDDHFLFKKEVERELQIRYPKKFIGAHALMSFTNVPFATCGQHIELQERITQQLCQNKHSLEQVDWAHAEKLVNSMIRIDLSDVKAWYE